MKNKSLTMIGSVILILVLLTAGGVVWIANAHIEPPAQTIEQTIPDDHIPH